jgi:hypothetical protein
MSERFAKKWESKPQGESFSTQLKNTVRSPPPLKPALDAATRKLDMQINKLDQANERFTQKDKALFAKLVDSYTKHDQAHANIYATELAEIRKMSKLIMNARLALTRLLSHKNRNRTWRCCFSTGPVSVCYAAFQAELACIAEQKARLGDIGNSLVG